LHVPPVCGRSWPHPPGLKAPANRCSQKHIHTSANKEKRDSNTKYTYNTRQYPPSKGRLPTTLKQKHKHKNHSTTNPGRVVGGPRRRAPKPLR
uniref:Uncharacterized protein n=1 Tax=Oreochromis aureus TaxID=47969 RepID=A0A668UF21_OREAU